MESYYTLRPHKKKIFSGVHLTEQLTIVCVCNRQFGTQAVDSYKPRCGCILHALLSGLLVKQRDAFHRKLHLRSQDNNHFCSIPATFHEYEHKLSQALHYMYLLQNCGVCVMCDH